MRLGILLIAAVLVGACAGASGPTLDPDATPAPAPDGWQYHDWDDPALELAVPPDWTSFRPDEVVLEAIAPDPSLDAGQNAYQNAFLSWLKRKMDTGALRLTGSGPVETPPIPLDRYGYFSVFVEAGDASLEAFADRWASESPSALLTRTPVTLPAGRAIRLDFRGQIGDFPPFVDIDYLFLLPDGRSLVVSFAFDSATGDTEPDSDHMAAFASRVVETLRSHQASPGN